MKKSLDRSMRLSTLWLLVVAVMLSGESAAPPASFDRAGLPAADARRIILNRAFQWKLKLLIF